MKWVNKLKKSSEEVLKQVKGRRIPRIGYENDLACFLFYPLQKRLRKGNLVITENYEKHWDYKRYARMDMAIFKESSVKNLILKKGIPDSYDIKEYEVIIELKVRLYSTERSLLEVLDDNLTYLTRFKIPSKEQYLICFDYNGHLDRKKVVNINKKWIKKGLILFM